jgi:hypothetical protein
LFVVAVDGYELEAPNGERSRGWVIKDSMGEGNGVVKSEEGDGLPENGSSWFKP